MKFFILILIFFISDIEREYCGYSGRFVDPEWISAANAEFEYSLNEANEKLNDQADSLMEIEEKNIDNLIFDSSTDEENLLDEESFNIQNREVKFDRVFDEQADENNSMDIQFVNSEARVLIPDDVVFDEWSDDNNLMDIEPVNPVAQFAIPDDVVFDEWRGENLDVDGGNSARHVENYHFDELNQNDLPSPRIERPSVEDQIAELFGEAVEPFNIIDLLSGSDFEGEDDHSASDFDEEVDHSVSDFEEDVNMKPVPNNPPRNLPRIIEEVIFLD